MRTESSTSSASAATRLRGEMARASRWVNGRGRPARIGLVAVAVVVLIGLVYWTIPLDREESIWLYSGRKFSPDQAVAIQKALAAEGIPFKADGSNRIGVTSTRWPAAISALAKHHVEPPSLEGIDREPPESDLWASPEDRSQRKQWILEHELKAIIEGYPGIRSAHVTITRSMVKEGLRPTWNMAGSVVLDADPRPTHRVINAIRTLLSTNVADLRADAVTISDRTGNFFIKAGDPSAASITQMRAREEELREGLLDNLREIPGIDVVVQVEPATSADPAPTGRAARHIPPPPPPPAEEMAMNHPIGLDAEAEKPSEPEPPVDPPPARPSTTSTTPPLVGRANVWVKVPRSYYIRIFRDLAPNRNPSQDDLIPYSQKTRELVENAVSVLVPRAERGRVLVSTIPDDLAVIVPGVSTEAERGWPTWLPPVALGAGAGLVVVAVFFTGFGIMASRRPEARPSRTTVRSGLSVDAPSGPVPGPSERVRDLVRRDPGAAAGVLQRWIGQGEGGPVE
jgi:type III secretory pathway lipoprotein EscJ